MTKKLVAIVLGLAALILNPFFACSARVSNPWRYGADEMRAAVEGTWTITVPAGGPDAPAFAYTVTIRQSDRPLRNDGAGAAAARSLVAPAAACAHRALVRAAAACIDSSEMPLDVQIVTGPSSGHAPGQLSVYGYVFREGHLTLTIDGRHVSATITPSGAVLGAATTTDGRDLAIEMVRVAPAA